MKKARVMLAALAIFAVAGGSLAFKAKKSTDTVFTGPQCSVTLHGFTTTNVAGELVTASTVFEGAKCTTTFITAGR